MSLNRSDRRAHARIVSVWQSSSSWGVSGLLERGLRHQRAGKLAQAKAAYIEVLKRNPSQADALHLLGLVAYQLGRNTIATATIRRAIEIEPGIALYRCSLGNALKALGRMEEAIGAYATAIRLEPDFAEARYNLGTALADLGRGDEAAAAYGSAAGLDPRFAGAHCNCGVVLPQLGHLETASAADRHAIRCEPDHAEAHANLGKTLQALGQPEEALAAYDAAIRIKPYFALAHASRGLILKALGRLDEAAAAQRTALRFRPDFAEAHYNLGLALKARGRPGEAILAYGNAIRLRPDFTEAHVELGRALLRSGDFARGWGEYGWRPRGTGHASYGRGFAQPAWAGEALNGRTILLHAGQGLGDTIQFCRYAAMVAILGGRVILEVPRPLLGLLSSLSGVARLVAAGDPLPPFDLHRPLLSLPQAFGTELDTIPGPHPYLAAKPEKIAFWRDRLGAKTRPRVGLVWSGGPLPDLSEGRDIPLRVIGRLSDRAVDFISLQKGEPAARELARIGAATWPRGNLIDAAPAIHDFADTAGLMETLDLLISVDTAAAHLAAAMGRPVWLLNRFDGCWRWLEQREDSPWYPSLRLFRQTAPGDWHGVMDRIIEALGSI